MPKFYSNHLRHRATRVVHIVGYIQVSQVVMLELVDNLVGIYGIMINQYWLIENYEFVSLLLVNLLNFSLFAETVQFTARDIAWNFGPIVKNMSFVFTRAVVDTCIEWNCKMFISQLKGIFGFPQFSAYISFSRDNIWAQLLETWQVLAPISHLNNENYVM